jgi:histidinol-phosphatase (PHP family)
MVWTNYHGHCNYCDGKETPEAYIKAAVEKGLAAYGFSSHGPLPFPTEWAIQDDKVKQYIADIKEIQDKYGDKLEIYLGMEIDYIPGVVEPINQLSKKYNLDYTIGSVHFVDRLPDGTPWNIDGPRELFMEGVNKIFDGDIKKAVKRYYHMVREMIKKDCPDVLGHFDKIKMQLINHVPFDESEDWYREEIADTLETIVNSDAIVEINTRAHYKHNLKNVYPSKWIIRDMAELDIPVIIQSDAHKPDEIAKSFDITAKMLGYAGYDHVFSLIDGEWQEFEFDRTGLKI